jgi:hypothetical protein
MKSRRRERKKKMEKKEREELYLGLKAKHFF